MDIFETSKEWKNKADILIKEKEIVSDLAEFGEVYFTGAYSYDLMMHGDIDISIVRQEGYSIEEVFEIFRTLYFKGSFRSYFIGGDWDDPRKGSEFPDGHYIGLKEKINGERWKLDLWFLNSDEYKKRSNDSNVISMNKEQRKLVLECKKYRNDNKISITGQEIYTGVIEAKIKKAEDLKSIVKQK